VSEPAPKMIDLIVHLLFFTLMLPFIYYFDELIEAVESFF
jgi:hypothetical protein